MTDESLFVDNIFLITDNSLDRAQKLFGVDLMFSQQEQEFLEALNADLPKNVDWKQGALTYMSQKLHEEGEICRRLHLIKPYYSVGYSQEKINYQLRFFLADMGFFLNFLSLLNTHIKPKFLDVACGTGWTTHYLAKLNLEVVGFDISPDMIKLARERLESDPFPMMESNEPPARFLVHDIEENPLNLDEKFDIALFESALHHFVNPIAALRNISQNLTDDGIILIFEAVGPGDERGAQERIAIMEKYQTLERPYTREQLTTILNFAGFKYFQFLYPIHGLFPENSQSIDFISNQILFDKCWNITIASRKAEELKRYLNLQNIENSLVIYEGFYAPEYADERVFRWAKSSARIIFSKNVCDRIKFKVSSSLPLHTKKTQDIYIFRDGKKIEQFQFNPQMMDVAFKMVEVNNLSNGGIIEIASDSVFSPAWFGLNDDTRSLSFMIDLNTESFR